MDQPRCVLQTCSRRLAFLFVGLACAELLFLTALVPLDAAGYGWVQAQRSCELDQLTFSLKEFPLTVLIILGGVLLVWLCSQRRWTDAWYAAFVVTSGELLCDVLKDSFARARPSALPPAFDGNSFPSSHVIAALLIAGVVGGEVLRQRRATGVKLFLCGILASGVAAVSWQRVYTGQHWFSDVIGSSLLAGAWFCFTASRPAVLRLSWRFVLVWSGVLLYSQVASHFSSLQLPLPSLRSAYGVPLLNLSFGETTPPLQLQGPWGEHSAEPAGPMTWANGEEVGVEVDLPQRQSYTIKLAVRPIVQSRSFSCFPLEVSVNQQPAGRLFLYRGWREYTLKLDPHRVTPGATLVTFHAGVDFPTTRPDRRTVAFLYLRFFAD
jgi:membrane-associated phospholipid phosphatase